MAWALVYAFYTGWTHDVATSVIQGFTSKEACEAAKPMVEDLARDAKMAVTIKCVKVA